jgi:hypothetical protein
MAEWVMSGQNEVAPNLPFSAIAPIANIRCGSRIVREVLLVANRSGYQWRGIWDSFDGVWGDIIIRLPRRHGDAIQP